MSIRVEPLACSRDPRGMVCEPLAPDAIPDQQNVHVVLTEPGHVRGNHYHHRATEVMIVWGPALVRVRDDQGLKDHTVPENEVYRFVIPPGVAHAIRNTGSTLQILVAFSSVPHDPHDPDTERELLIE